MIFVREGKESIMQNRGERLKFRPFGVASGGFCGPRKLVAEMLLNVEINLV